MDILLWFFGMGLWFYIQSSVWESLFHEYILDIGPRQRAFLFRHRRWLPALWHVHYDHNVLHHFRTYRRTYVEQFGAPAEEDELKRVLAGQVDEAAFRQMVRSRYGATFTWAGVLPYSIPILANFLWLPLTPGPAAAGAVIAANLIFATPYFAYSKWIHLHMHSRFEDAMRDAPWPVRLVLRSPYGVAVRISHFVHHRDPKRNYNLQYFADRLRGRWRAPTRAEWDEMIEMGLVLPRHRAALEGRSFLLHPF
jgi:hypothetical protein